MAAEPYFSLVIPTYNRAAMLPQTLASIRAQSFPAFEALVVDDGSTDNTAEVVQAYAAEDERFRYLPKANEERGAARNYGGRHAHGRYITFHDSDDILYPTALEQAYKLCQQHHEPPVAALNYQVISPAGKVLKPPQSRPANLNQALIAGNHIGCMGYVRADIFAEHQFVEDRGLAGSEDWEYWLRLACRYPIVHSDFPATGVIQHEQRSVMDVDIRKLLHRRELLMQYRLKDEQFLRYYRKDLPVFLASNYSYIALHVAMAGKAPLIALHYFWRALRQHPASLFSRRTANILRFLGTQTYRRSA